MLAMTMRSVRDQSSLLKTLFFTLDEAASLPDRHCDSVQWWSHAGQTPPVSKEFYRYSSVQLSERIARCKYQKGSWGPATRDPSFVPSHVAREAYGVSSTAIFILPFSFNPALVQIGMPRGQSVVVQLVKAMPE